jgi:lipid A 3-O-deacylase
MRRLGAVGLMALGAAMLTAGKAEAGVDEISAGVYLHNSCLFNCKNANKEPEPNVEAEMQFSDIQSWTWIHHPRPYVMASVNLRGATSYAGAGLAWKFDMSPHWAFTPSFGIVVHNGELNNKFANGTPEAAHFFEEHVLLGSRALFRTSFGLTHQMSDHWNVQAHYEHLSHGQILGHGRNQGLDEYGIRIGYDFGPH